MIAVMLPSVSAVIRADGCYAVGVWGLTMPGNQFWYAPSPIPGLAYSHVALLFLGISAVLTCSIQVRCRRGLYVCGGVNVGAWVWWSVVVCVFAMVSCAVLAAGRDGCQEGHEQQRERRTRDRQVRARDAPSCRAALRHGGPGFPFLLLLLPDVLSLLSNHRVS